MIVGGAWGLEPTGHLSRGMSPLSTTTTIVMTITRIQKHKIKKIHNTGHHLRANSPGDSSLPVEIAIENKRKYLQDHTWKHASLFVIYFVEMSLMLLKSTLC